MSQYCIFHIPGGDCDELAASAKEDTMGLDLYCERHKKLVKAEQEENRRGCEAAHMKRYGKPMKGMYGKEAKT